MIGWIVGAVVLLVLLFLILDHRGDEFGDSL